MAIRETPRRGAYRRSGRGTGRRPSGKPDATAPLRIFAPSAARFSFARRKDSQCSAPASPINSLEEYSSYGLIRSYGFSETAGSSDCSRTNGSHGWPIEVAQDVGADSIGWAVFERGQSSSRTSADARRLGVEHRCWRDRPGFAAGTAKPQPRYGCSRRRRSDRFAATLGHRDTSDRGDGARRAEK